MSLVKLNRHNRYAYSPITERPTFTWPGDKQLALSICNNIEVFSFLGGLGSDSATLTAPQTARNYAWRDYGNRVGQWYVFDLLDEFGFPASHNVNSMLFEECPQIIQRIMTRSGADDVGLWRPRSFCRFHLPRRRTTQAARLTPSITYPQARASRRYGEQRYRESPQHVFFLPRISAATLCQPT